jgi:hemolysin activation/secretion protein
LFALVCAFGFAVLAHARAPLSGAVITGSTAYTPETLFPVYRDMLGREIDPLRARAILSSIESKYVHDGYLMPRLILRDELLNDGILRVDVYESKLTDVQVSGVLGPHQKRIEKVRARLLAEPLLRQQTISLALRQLRALPGLTIVANTKQDPSTPNGLILTLRIEYSPVSGSLEWTNFGTNEIGPNFISATATLNSLLGGREQLNLVFVTAADYSNYHGAGFTFSTPVADYGTSVSVTGFRSASDPSFGDSAIALAFPHDIAGVRVTQSLLDSGRQAVSAYIGYDYDDSSIRYEGIDLETDNLRVLEGGLQADGRISELPYAAGLSVRRGLNGFGAGVSAINGMSLPTNYTVVVGKSILVVPLNSILSSRLSLLGQWTGDVLPYEERFKIGSDVLARAFKTAEFAGDDGLGMKAELRARLPSPFARYGTPTLFGYSDYGEAWQHNLSTQEHATTVGLGFGWDSRFLVGSIELAKPVAVSAGVPMDWNVLGDVTLRF